jgi:GH24 family phage-related lysozyme (muramidase)
MTTLKDRIKKNEGFRLKRYEDSLGFWTIYYGHLCRDGEVYLNTVEDAEKYLDADIKIATQGAKNLFPEFNEFSQSRKEALIELVFNLGEPKICRKFPRFCNNVNRGAWEEAANELQYADGHSVLSKWYQDVKEKRAEEILELLRTA